jgi:hypothetical protein
MPDRNSGASAFALSEADIEAAVANVCWGPETTNQQDLKRDGFSLNRFGIPKSVCF